MSISKTLTRICYQEKKSDLRIGDIVNWDVMNANQGTRHAETVAYIQKYGNHPMVVKRFHIQHVIVHWLETDQPIRDYIAFGGFFHNRFVRNEFLTAAKRAIEDAQD